MNIKKIFFYMIVSVLSSFPAYGSKSFKEHTFIRDAEIESILKGYIRPLFQTAGLNPNSVRLFLVVDSEINAAASTRYSIFINTGLLLRAHSPGEVIGVLAHETGHIAGGHLAGREEALRKMSLASMAAIALGLTTALLGNTAEGASSALLAGQHLAIQNFMHYNRGQEAAADQAAVRYLKILQWPAQGLLDFMQVLEKQELLSAAQQEAYIQTHPYSRDRVDFFYHYLSTSPDTEKKFPLHFQAQFERMQVKLKAFLDPPLKTLTTYPTHDHRSLAQYARAIAYFRDNRLADGLALLEPLIAKNPTDPYLYDLKGQMHYENGNLSEAIRAYRKALALKPEGVLIQQALGIALIQFKTPQALQEAIGYLTQVTEVEPESPSAWHALATAYGQQKNMGRMALCLAEEALVNNRYQQALDQSKRALLYLSKTQDKSYILRAHDLQEECLTRLKHSDHPEANLF